MSASCARLKGTMHMNVGEVSLARTTTLKIGSNVTLCLKLLEMISSEGQFCDRKGTVSIYINILSKNSCFVVPKGDARFAICLCSDARWRR